MCEAIAEILESRKIMNCFVLSNILDYMYLICIINHWIGAVYKRDLQRNPLKMNLKKY